MLSLKDRLAEIVKIDNTLREYITSRTVIQMNDPHVQSLKQARKAHVRAIQNYKP